MMSNDDGSFNNQVPAAARLHGQSTRRSAQRAHLVSGVGVGAHCQHIQVETELNSERGAIRIDLHLKAMESFTTRSPAGTLQQSIKN